MALDWRVACQLYGDGWLSFDPRAEKSVNEAQEAELRLVGSLAAAGCDAAMMERLLHGLRKPYQYRPDRLYFDWFKARWRLLPVFEEPDPDFSSKPVVENTKIAGRYGLSDSVAFGGNNVALIFQGQS